MLVGMLQSIQTEKYFLQQKRGNAWFFRYDEVIHDDLSILLDNIYKIQILYKT
jgi:hypothetical protein